MSVRLFVVIIAAGLLGLDVVRNALVMAVAATSPREAAALWRDHPSVEISLAMTQIANSARLRRPIPSSTLMMLLAAARKEPLAPEPFLVRGEQAEFAGDEARAQREFEAAQWRNPRSLAAAQFLAERYIRTGNITAGLREITALAQLSPRGYETAAPYLSAVARHPANWPALRALFNHNPELADKALAAMATDPTTTATVIALADRRQKLEDAHWLSPLLATLVDARDYDRARRIWEQQARTQDQDLIYDTAFIDNSAPPPFNWSLTSSSVGLAERQSGGRLRVISYGREDGILATQLTMLSPGTYQLSMELHGDIVDARRLNWSIWCDKSDSPIASVALDAASMRGWRFTVPSACPAQWLKLSAFSRDQAHKIDVTLSSLKLQKATRHA